MNNNIYLFLVVFFTSIDLLFMTILQYVYICDISYYSIMSFILQHLFIRIILLLIFQWYLDFLWCWCIWLRETLLQTWQKFFSFRRRAYDIQWTYFQWNRLFVVGLKYPIANFTHCMIYITNTFHYLYQGKNFTDDINNIRAALFVSFLNVINGDSVPPACVVGLSW